MAEEKYISKVRISGENFVIRDKEALAAADSLRKKVQAVEDSINAMAGLTPAQLKEIKDNINLIKQELEGTTVNNWTTLVDKLAGINDTVKTYVDNAVAGAKTYADTKASNAKSEAISVAASDATTKANTAKTEAISAAASDATTKANTAKNEAIDYVQGTDDDDLTKDTIWGAKKYADDAATTAKTEAINAAASDATSKANTALSNAKTYADNKDIEVKNSLIGKSTDATTADTIWGARKYTDEKIKTLSNTAFKVSRIEEGGEGILVFSTVS